MPLHRPTHTTVSASAVTTSPPTTLTRARVDNSHFLKDDALGHRSTTEGVGLHGADGVRLPVFLSFAAAHHTRISTQHAGTDSHGHGHATHAKQPQCSDKFRQPTTLAAAPHLARPSVVATAHSQLTSGVDTCWFSLAHGDTLTL
jgi:hypothetical protein